MSKRARGEFRELTAMVEFRDLELERIEAEVESPMRRFVERGAIALAIGEAMGFSEGRVDLARVREIGHTIGQFKRTDPRRRPRPPVPKTHTYKGHGILHWTTRLETVEPDVQR